MAYTFNGTSQSLSMASLPSASLAPPFTMLIWANRAWTTTISERALVHLSTASDLSNRGFYLLHSKPGGSDSQFSVLTRNGISATAIATVAVSLSGPGWIPIVGRWTSSSARSIHLYGATASNVVSNAPSYGTEETYIGQRAGGTTWFEGSVGDFAMWNVALSDAEIDVLLRTNEGSGIGGSEVGAVDPRAVRSSSLLCHFRLLHGSDLKCPFTNLTFTENGSPTVVAHPPVKRPMLYHHDSGHAKQRIIVSP